MKRLSAICSGRSEPTVLQRLLQTFERLVNCQLWELLSLCLVTRNIGRLDWRIRWKETWLLLLSQSIHSILHMIYKSRSVFLKVYFHSSFSVSPLFPLYTFQNIIKIGQFVAFWCPYMVGSHFSLRPILSSLFLIFVYSFMWMCSRWV